MNRLSLQPMRWIAVAAILLASSASELTTEAGAASSVRVCGSVKVRGVGGGKRVRAVSLGRSVSCRTADAVARRATHGALIYGARVSAPRGWRCSVALRPANGKTGKYLVGCRRGGTLLVAVRWPALMVSGDDAQPTPDPAPVPEPEPPRFIQQLYDGDIDLARMEAGPLPPEVMPAYIKLGSGQGWEIASWSDWGAERTLGLGTYHNHTDDSTTGTVALSGLRQCGRYMLYTLMEPQYDDPLPESVSYRPGPISIAAACY